MADGWHADMTRDEFARLNELHQRFVLDLICWFEDDTLLSLAECDDCGAVLRGYPAAAARARRVLCPKCCEMREAHTALRKALEARDDSVTPESAIESMHAAVDLIAQRSRQISGRPPQMDSEARKQAEARYRARLEQEAQRSEMRQREGQP